MIVLHRKGALIMPIGIMRRKELLLNDIEAKAILMETEIATISTVDEDGQPYGVVVNYAFDGSNKVYFHSAGSGHKLDNIKQCPKVCVTAVSAHKVLREQVSAFYRSVTGFGTAKIVENEDTKAKAIQLIMDKYCPGIDCRGRAHTAAEATVVEITIEILTGKRSARTLENPGK
jgi:nitroimidazol reductase NimA-like FMN-containing flavoprotein (pyridoxamine 5'-phosphate oxidase superfamily)